MRRLFFCLMAMVSVLTLSAQNNYDSIVKNETDMQMEANPVLSNIMARRSVRKYLDKPVEHEKLEAVALAGINAPSAMNRQNWAVRIIEDQKLMADVKQQTHQAQTSISDRISVGACIMRNDSVIGINEGKRFALHSVMKFPQALYVVDYLNRKGLTLDDTIEVNKADLMQDTWSPMLRLFERKKAFSFAELLELSLGQSDNNACDLLFKYCGKPREVEKYMRKLGFDDIHVRMTEEQMHKNPTKAIENSSTPAEMVRLFEWFYHHKDDNRCLTFIWKAMADCSTGLKRIPAAIPADARIVHKTGTGFPSAEGLQDMNDAGIILMPDGNYAIIAVFITHSPAEAVIANIARQLLDGTIPSLSHGATGRE